MIVLAGITSQCQSSGLHMQLWLSFLHTCGFCCAEGVCLPVYMLTYVRGPVLTAATVNGSLCCLRAEWQASTGFTCAAFTDVSASAVSTRVWMCCSLSLEGWAELCLPGSTTICLVRAWYPAACEATGEAAAVAADVPHMAAGHDEGQCGKGVMGGVGDSTACLCVHGQGKACLKICVAGLC
jgi:hypothetical protein